MNIFYRKLVPAKFFKRLRRDLDNPQPYAVRNCHMMSLLLCQQMWMKWHDSQADSMWVFAFDFSKAFDHVNHAILFDKLSQLPFNPYIYKWIRDF